MIRKRLPWWWLLLALPLGARVGLDVLGGISRPGIWLTVAVPALLSLVLTGWAHFSRAPLAVQLEKELTLLGPVAIAGMPIGGALMCVPDHWVRTLGLGAWGAGAMFAGYGSMRSERASLSLARWLLQPRSRAALLAQKYAVLVTLVGTQVAQVCVALLAPAHAGDEWTVHDEAGVIAVLLPVFATIAICMLYISMVNRRAEPSAWWLYGSIISVALAGVVDDALFVPAISAWCVVCVVASFRHIRRIDPFDAGALEPRLPGFSLGLRGPWGQLLLKEVRLQRGTFTLGFVMVLAWVAWLSAHTLLPVLHPPAITPPAAILGLLWSLSVCAALLAGAAAFTEERSMETLVAQEALMPRRWLFTAKAVAALSAAAVVSALLPMLLLTVAPGWAEVAREFKEARVPAAGSLGLAWLGVMTACAAVGLLASVVQPDTRRAFVTAMAVAAACVALLGGAAVCDGLWLLSAQAAAGNTLDCSGAWRLAPSLHGLARGLSTALSLSPLVLVAAVTLLTGRARWRGRSGVQPWLVAAVVLFVGTGAALLGGQQLSEATNRAELCGTNLPNIGQNEHP